jgi:hypothetical protein
VIVAGRSSVGALSNCSENDVLLTPQQRLLTIATAFEEANSLKMSTFGAQSPRSLVVEADSVWRRPGSRPAAGTKEEQEWMTS